MMCAIFYRLGWSIRGLAWLSFLGTGVSHAQDYVNEWEPKPPQPFISKVEFVVGAAVIYGGGSDFLEEMRVPNLGFYGGINFCHSLSGRIGLELKVAYEQKGIKYIVHPDNNGNSPPFVTKVIAVSTLNYATVTLLPRIVIKKNVPLYFGVGPYAGLALKNRIYGEIYWDDTSVTKYSSTGSPSPSYEETDYGIAVTLGYDFVIGKKSGATIQFLYSGGLQNVSGPSYVAEMNNNNFSLAVGISFDRTRKLEAR